MPLVRGVYFNPRAKRPKKIPVEFDPEKVQSFRTMSTSGQYETKAYVICTRQDNVKDWMLLENIEPEENEFGVVMP